MSAEAKQPQGLVPGRIVHFVDSAGGICPAVVIAAGEGKFTRLHVFGFTKSQDAVLDVEYDVNGHASTWHWMFEGQENLYDKIESAVMKDAALPQECLQGVGPTQDPWAHRSDGMKCRTCMWYVAKAAPGHGALIVALGRCRRHSPTMNGYPVGYPTDWCGDHKLDEKKA
jgi:hypothetical protein